MTRRSRNSQLPPAVILLVLCVLSGCMTTNTIQVAELSRLDGFEARLLTPASPPELQTLAGGRVTFKPDSRLYLELPSASVGGRFDSIRVHEGVFHGRMADGQQVQAPVDRINAARVGQPNVPATLAVVGAVLVATLLAGVLIVASSGEPQFTPGRALRVGGKICAAPLAVAEGWRRDQGREAGPDISKLSVAARSALAVFWTTSARGEHASVPAFARLSMTLMSLGAPARLVEAAHRAALDEIEHARISFAFAGAYAGHPVAPGPMTALQAAPSVTAGSLAALAEESLIDGCLMEGVAAAVAGESSVRARDPAVRRALKTIADEESSHAQLAWDVVAWCCDQGGPELRRGLRRFVHAMPSVAPPPETPPSVEAELAAHGCLTASDWRILFQRTQVQVAARLAEFTAQDEQHHPDSAGRVGGDSVASNSGTPATSPARA